MPADRDLFQRDYLVRLPLPLAQLYARACTLKNPRNRHDNAYYLFEAIVKLGVATLAACYLQELQRGAPHQAKVEAALCNLARPSQGHWVAMLRELSRYYRDGDERHPLFRTSRQLHGARDDLPGILDLYRRIANGPDAAPSGVKRCSPLDLFGALVQYRNAVFGHGANRPEAFYERELGPKLLPAANELFAEGTLNLLGPTGSRLVQLTDLRILDEAGRVEVGLRELAGTLSAPLAPVVVTAEQAAGLAPQRVAVLWPGGALPLRLDPLLLFRGQELAEEVLFLNSSYTRKNVGYLSYTTGKQEQDEAMVPAVAELLRRIEGSGLGSDELAERVEQIVAALPETERPAKGPAQEEYEKLAQLGEGGMGVVWLVRQRSLGRLVALKTLPDEKSADEVARAHFDREIRLLARCEHANIVKLFSRGTLPDGRPYCTMEYVPGCDLDRFREELANLSGDHSVSRLGGAALAEASWKASRLVRERTAGPHGEPGAGAVFLPPLSKSPAQDNRPEGYVRRAVSLMRDVALALQTVHDQGIVHRDLKPANLMMTPDGARLVLMDFGLARRESQSTQAGGGFTLRYAAPEQLTERQVHFQIGPATDVRGLGVCLWELLTGRQLFVEVKDPQKLANWVMTRDVPRLRTVDPALDRDLEAIVARATERDVERRIPSAGRLADYLQLYLDVKVLPIRTPGIIELLGRWVREHRGLAATVAGSAALLLLTAAVAFLLINQARRRAIDLADANLNLANEKGRLADANRALAKQKGKLAGRMTILARRNGKLAREKGAALQSEKVARRLADERAEDLENASYIDRVALAYHEWQDANPGEAERLLEECPLRQRGWEWHYLKRLCHLDLVTLRVGNEEFNDLAFSPSGEWIATANGIAGAGELNLWQTRTGVRRWISASQSAKLAGVRFSPNGKWIATCARDGTITLWDPKNGKVLHQFKEHRGGVFRIAFSHDSRWLASGGKDGTVRLWDLGDWKKPSVVLTRHAAPVNQVALSRDGIRLASCSRDGQVKIWNRAEKRVERAWRAHELGGTNCVAFSPDSTALATGGADRRVKVWEVATGHLLLSLRGHTEAVISVAFNPKGKRLVSGSWDRTVKVWDTAREREALFTLRGHTGAVWAVAYSPGGTRIASVGSGILKQGEAKVWKPDGDGAVTVLPWAAAEGWAEVVVSPDGRQLAWGTRDFTLRVQRLNSPAKPVELPGHKDIVSALVFLPDDRLVSAGYDRTVKVWDVAKRRLLRTLPDQPATVRVMALHPDGRRLVLGRKDGALLLWNPDAPAPPRPLGQHDGLTGLAFAPDGRLATCGDETIVFWDVNRRAQTATLTGGHRGRVLAVAFSPNGKQLASGGQDGTVRLWERAKKRPGQKFRGHKGAVLRLTFSPGGRRLVSASVDGTVKLWDARRGQLVFTLPPLDLGTTSVVFTPDGETLVTAGPGKFPRLWWAPPSPALTTLPTRPLIAAAVAYTARGRLLAAGITTNADAQLLEWNRQGKLVRSVTLDVRGVTAAAFSPDRRRLALASSPRQTAGVLRVYDVATMQEIRHLSGHRQAVRSLAFSPDGKLLASLGDEGRVKLWNVATGVLKRSWPAQRSGLAFSRDGRRLAWAVAQGAVIWDLAADKKERTFLGHDGSLTSLAFSPDGLALATAGRDGVILIWDRKSGLPVRSLMAKGGIWGLTFHDNGRTLAGGSGDGQVRVWDAHTGREAARLRGHAGAVWGVAWAPGGRTLASGSIDGTVKTWDIGSLAGRGLPGQPRRELPWMRSRERGQAHAAAGRWQAAARALVKAIDQGADDPAVWHEAAVAYLLAGDQAGYERVCASALDQAALEFPGSVDATATVNALVWMAVLSGQGDVKRVHRAIRVLVNRCPDAFEREDTGLSIMWLLYRRSTMGKLDKKPLLLLADRGKNWRSIKGFPPLGNLGMALVYQRVGEGKKAQQFLDRARRWIDQAERPQPAGAWAITRPWAQSGELRLLRREAEALILRSKPSH
jgi:WD40 repeat protein/serine/threonine protein kinase